MKLVTKYCHIPLNTLSTNINLSYVEILSSYLAVNTVSLDYNKTDSVCVGYIQNTEARSCNQCYNVKAISVTCSECVSVPLVIQHEIRMRHTVICGTSVCRIIFHIVS
jgi:hypothetical protein